MLRWLLGWAGLAKKNCSPAAAASPPLCLLCCFQSLGLRGCLGFVAAPIGTEVAPSWYHVSPSPRSCLLGFPCTPMRNPSGVPCPSWFVRNSGGAAVWLSAAAPVLVNPGASAKANRPRARAAALWLGCWAGSRHKPAFLRPARKSRRRRWLSPSCEAKAVSSITRETTPAASRQPEITVATRRSAGPCGARWREQ